MSTCRIDFEGLRSESFGKVQLPTTLPHALALHIPDANWKTFCDRINAILEPLNSPKKRLSRLFVFFFVTTFVLAGIFFYIIPAGQQEQSNDDAFDDSGGGADNTTWTGEIESSDFVESFDETNSSTGQQQLDDDVVNSNNNEDVNPFFFYGIFAWMLSGIGILFLLRSRLDEKMTHALGEIKMILDEISEHYPNLTFHLREERIYGTKSRSYLNRYIEVEISNVQAFVASPYE